MTYITNRDDSRVLRFKMRTPRRIIDRVRGRQVLISMPPFRDDDPITVLTTVGEFVKFSLRTHDDVAKFRDGIARAHLRKVFDAAENGPTPVSHRQLVALSKEVYDLYVGRHGDNPGPLGDLAGFKAFNRATREGRIVDAPPFVPGEIDRGESAVDRFGPNLTTGVNALPRSEAADGLEQRFGLLADWVLALHGIQVDLETRERLLAQVDHAATDAALRLKRYARGDHSSDSAENRFPTFVLVDRLSLTDLFDRWVRETNPAPSTLTTWRGVIRSLIAHMGRDDARAIDDVSVIAWKDTLVESGLSAKTINDTYVTGLAQLWGRNERSERTVPIHSAIVDEGFLDFVRQRGEGPLFYKPKPRRERGPAQRHGSKSVSNHLAAWIGGQGFNDPRRPQTMRFAIGSRRQRCGPGFQIP